LQVRSCCNAHHESKSLNARQHHIHVSARSFEHAVGPVGIIGDPRNLEIPLLSGKAITTEALQVRSCCNAHHESMSLNVRQRHMWDP
jgi:hypothetical protein